MTPKVGSLILLTLFVIAVLWSLYQDIRPTRWQRGIKHPWLLFGSDGSVKVDFTHPRMQKKIRDACGIAEKRRKETKQ